uniref:(northern house mosquito) hypothetical protein n=1 Tax=Culex pipiens TaxID=7175 RepID=A0A8D8HFA6_CULPI
MNSRDHPPPLEESLRPHTSMFDALASQICSDLLQSSYQSHMKQAAGSNLCGTNPKHRPFRQFHLRRTINRQTVEPCPGPIGKYQNLSPNGWGPGMPPCRGSNQQSHAIAAEELAATDQDHQSREKRSTMGFYLL